MSRATKALDRACAKFESAYDACDWLMPDCGLASVPLSQADYNYAVDNHEGDEMSAKKELARGYKDDLKHVIGRLKLLATAATAVQEALPAVAEEQLAALDEMEYYDENEDDNLGAA